MFHALLEKIDSVYAYEVLSPDPHFRLIFVLPFSFTYARAHKKGRTKRREMERKLRKEKWETKVSFQPPERRTHFYIVYSSIKTNKYIPYFTRTDCTSYSTCTLTKNCVYLVYRLWYATRYGKK